MEAMSTLPLPCPCPACAARRVTYHYNLSASSHFHCTNCKRYWSAADFQQAMASKLAPARPTGDAA